MLSDDGRHVIVFNGEIYNFLELRRELEAQGTIFRTQSALSRIRARAAFSLASVVTNAA